VPVSLVAVALSMRLPDRTRSPPSYTQLFRKLGEACGDDVASRIRLWIRRPFRAPFVGPAHEGRPVTACLGGVEIETMTGDHAAFAGIKLKKLGAGHVRFSQDLIDLHFADKLDQIPRLASKVRLLGIDRLAHQAESHRIIPHLRCVIIF
jgi:hypothetical protein